MSRCIVSRTAAGVTFLVQSAGGRTVAVSKPYANLDACKKGIVSLFSVLKTAPTKEVGEGGPNPKCEIGEDGHGFSFTVKSRNGKAVLTSVPYATKKACLRALSILRQCGEECEVLFDRQAGLLPLTVGGLGANKKDRVRKAPVAAPPKQAESMIPSLVVPPVAEPASVPTPVAPTSLQTGEVRVQKPRLVRIAPPATPVKNKSTGAKGILGALFKK